MDKLTQYLRGRQKKPNLDCYVCNKHNSITEWHHVYPVNEQSRDLKNDIGIADDDSFNNPTVVLCPNCHKYIHKLYKIKNTKEIGNFYINTLRTVGYNLSESLKMINIYDKYKEYES